jgi:hypothetical protein
MEGSGEGDNELAGSIKCCRTGEISSIDYLKESMLMWL